MRGSEGRYDDDDSQCRFLERWHGLPSRDGRPEDCRNQQHNQKQNVIVAGPDVPDTLLKRLQEAAAGGGGALKAQHATAGRYLRALHASTQPDDTQLTGRAQGITDTNSVDLLCCVDTHLREQEWLSIAGTVDEFVNGKAGGRTVRRNCQGRGEIGLDIR